MPKKRRPCPRGLYDGCPIPRELCSEDHARTGQWHCLAFLREFEWFVFGTAEEDVAPIATKGEIVSLANLLCVLEGMEKE